MLLCLCPCRTVGPGPESQTELLSTAFHLENWKRSTDSPHLTTYNVTAAMGQWSLPVSISPWLGQPSADLTIPDSRQVGLNYGCYALACVILTKNVAQQWLWYWEQVTNIESRAKWQELVQTWLLRVDSAMPHNRGKRCCPRRRGPALLTTRLGVVGAMGLTLDQMTERKTNDYGIGRELVHSVHLANRCRSNHALKKTGSESNASSVHPGTTLLH